MNRVDYLRDVFVWAYRRSAGRYPAVLQSLGDPDPFRLHHRFQIEEFIREVVTTGMDKARTARWIAEGATAKMEGKERARFIEVVETELASLHEGNIARYRLRPNQFDTWKKQWR